MPGSSLADEPGGIQAASEVPPLSTGVVCGCDLVRHFHKRARCVGLARQLVCSDGGRSPKDAAVRAHSVLGSVLL